MVQLAELQKIDDILESGRKPKGFQSFNQLEDQKSELEKHIETRMLRYYQRIRERYDDAVVFINDEHCSGCGMKIPPTMKQDIRRGGAKSCNTCGRILLWEVELD